MGNMPEARFGKGSPEGRAYVRKLRAKRLRRQLMSDELYTEYDLYMAKKQELEEHYKRGLLEWAEYITDSDSYLPGSTVGALNAINNEAQSARDAIGGGDYGTFVAFVVDMFIELMSIVRGEDINLPHELLKRLNNGY